MRGLSHQNQGDSEKEGRETQGAKCAQRKSSGHHIVAEDQQLILPELVKPEVFAAQDDDAVHVYEDDEYVDSDVFNVTGVGSTEMGWDHDASNKGIVLIVCKFPFS